jgi:hypothetical protein
MPTTNNSLTSPSLETLDLEKMAANNNYNRDLEKSLPISPSRRSR